MRTNGPTRLSTGLPARPPIPDHRPDRHRRRLPPLAVLPTLCTLANIVAGFAALFYATKSPEAVGPGQWSGLTVAGALIFLGILLDAVDGALARVMRTTSEVGAQLDSLADVITFGVAPAFMTLMLAGRYLTREDAVNVLGPETDNVLGKIIWGSAAVYVCCATLRLARFNVEVGGVSKGRNFKGLPSPGAAGLVASLVILHQHLLVARYLGEVTPAFAKSSALAIPFVLLLCAIAMVSSVPYVHFANRFIHGRKSFGYVARLVVLLALAAWWFQETLALLFTVYVLTGPVMAAASWISQRRMRPRAGPNET